ncbi:YdcF family protein [Ruegeria pomeroyi]|nr:YdcF family protein [Ruegeria pomeroyi]
MQTVFFVLAKLAGAALRLETWLLGLAVLAFWAGLRRQVRLQQRALGALVLAILGIGVLPLGDLMMRPFETGFPVVADPGPLDGIILLGGGEDLSASRRSGQGELGEGGDRYLTALALARRYPEARVLFAGGSGRLRDVAGATFSEAGIARRIFLDQGIAPERMLFEDRSRNTAENARLGHALAAPGPGERWALVTSAFHMPRALRSFAAAGWEGVVPVPADFRTRAWADGLGWNFHRNLGMMNAALREAVGRLAYAVTGR